MSFENYSCFMDNLQRFRGISFIICFPQRVFDKFSNVLSGYTDYRLRQPFFGGGSYVLFGDLVVVQSLSCVWLFATQWTAARCFPVLRYLLAFAQAHVCRVGDAIQPSHPLLTPFPPAFNLSQHQGLF